MTVEDVEFSRRYRTLIFNAGVTCGLWALVATGIYVAKEAERGDLDKLSVIERLALGETAPTISLAEARTKDDGHVAFVAAAPPAVQVATLAVTGPIARPARGAAVQPGSRQATTSPPRATAVLAGAERFDRCAPECETRDPLLVQAALPFDGGFEAGVFDEGSEPQAVENVVFRVGRQVVDGIVDVPRVTIETGMGAVSTGMGAVDSVTQWVR